ncbi:MAG: ThiF family adenylyltransferase [Candidatus Moraniibacteriota bacterium]
MDESLRFYQEAFSRNKGLLTDEQQEKLRESTVAIAGLGGAGGIYATTFARLGFGNFHIADLDVFEVGNMNRQAGSTIETAGKPKTEVIKNMILAINPYAKVTAFPKGIHDENIAEFLDNTDIVLDGIDFFSIATRRMLFRESQKRGLFALTAGPVGFGSSMLVFNPQGMRFDEYFDLEDSQTKEEMLVRFGLGLTPTLLQRSYFNPDAVNWKERKAPSLVTGTLLCANLVSCEALKIIFGEKVRSAPASLHFDPYLKKLKRVWVPFGNKNPIQRLKRIIMTSVLKSRGRL